MYLVLFAIVPCLLICIYREPIGQLLGVVDLPDGVRKVHAKATPLVGGLAVMIPMGIALLGSGMISDQRIQVIIGATSIALCVLGASDDRKHLAPLLRIAISTGILLPAILICQEFVLWQIRFQSGTLVLDLGLVAIPFTILCLLSLQNAVNMADGINGLVASLLLVWSGILLAVLPVGSGLWLTLFIFALCVAVVLGFNLFGVLFLGDGGSYSMSVFIGVLAIASHGLHPTIISGEDVVLMFLIPVVDMARLMVARILAGDSPWKADRNHLHHILVRQWGPALGLLAYVGLVAVPACGGLLLARGEWLLIAAGLSAYSLIVVGGQKSRSLAPAVSES